MLGLPARGLHRSVKNHNVDFAAIYDWIEASVLFLGEDVAGADIVDLLRENEIYRDQDFAWDLVNIVFAAIRSRARKLGEGYPIRVSGGTRVVGVEDWREFPAYAFCLALSLPSVYPTWARDFGQDYTAQGELFEALTAESVSRSFQDWTVHPTGWTKSNPSQLGKIVEDLAAQLGEATGELKRWTAASAKEAGLDLLCFRPFPDGRVGIPVYLLQCASGADWKTKLKTPDLRIWTKIITFAADPKKAFSMPYAIEEEEFIQRTNVVDGLLLDRHRLLAPGLGEKAWVSGELAAKLVDWVSERILTLPKVAALS
ncbi:hypothetical protein C8J40_11122 [Sphingomonas sp. PP-CC-3A-396]|nr:hypothetical protein C8J40_11122 [Sphingomonas sp. PP-CC-3A-396]